MYASRSYVDQGSELAVEIPSGEIGALLEGCLGSVALPLILAVAVLVLIFTATHQAKPAEARARR